MKLRSLRYDGTFHRLWDNTISLPDPNAYLIQRGMPVLEADGRVWSSDYPVVALFWPGSFFQMFMLLKTDRTDYYCNIITPIVQTPTDIWFVDLDYDVLVMDGQVSLVDEDDFLSRKDFYPNEWVDGAQAAKKLVLNMAREQIGPFSPAIAKGWRDWLAYHGTNSTGSGLRT